ncbi:MAG: HEAT repeat domain-containing protein, partial [Spirochaetaceae bacterium]|nr:HEAT repeat domain-containing protein [Spirochaetaceae bacterium]
TAAPLAAQQKVQIVPSPLTQELQKLFPELASGYIDLSGNGKPDQTADLNELVAESRVRDGQFQAQELLDFIVGNWRFIPLDKLKAVQSSVKATPGALNELIAIDFAASLEEAIRQKEAMGDGLYLTPSAYKDAMGRMGAIVSTMSAAYKKEGAKGESEFVAGRDALFGMIEKGYPLPQDLPEDDRATLATAMVNAAMKEGTANPARTRAAIRVLGQLKAVEAAPYLVQLAGGKEFPAEAMRALGEIGYKPAMPVVAKQLKSSTDLAVRKAALQASGAIGGAEGLDAVLDLVKAPARDALPPALLESATLALAGIAQKGNPEPRIQTALRELAATDKPAVRRIAATVLGSFITPQSTESLLALLASDKDVAVRKAALVSLNRQKGDTVLPALMKTLKENDLDPELKRAALQAVGDNPGGSQAVTLVVDALADKDAEVRASASAALRKLYLVPANQQIVSGSLTRSLLASQDENFLAEATALLASLADPSSLPTLLALLQKPQPEVKRSAAWALYRIKSSSNTKVVDELQKLVTNESESVSTRANAVRALGAIGFDSPQHNVWQTLVTAAQMRGEKYSMLRLFAVRALGQLAGGKPQAVAALSRIASRESDLELRKEAVGALKSLAPSSPEAAEALAASFAQAEDLELRLMVVEALADMGSERSAALAGELLAQALSQAQKRRLVYALSQGPSEASAAAILEAARDEKLGELAGAVLEGYPASLMAPLVARRLRTETDKNVLAVLQALDAKFAD